MSTRPIALALGLLGTPGTWACSSNATSPPPPPVISDTGVDAGASPTALIAVSGTASVHPVALALYGDGGLLGPVAPSLSGVELRIDEPLRVAAPNDPNAHLADLTLADPQGSFTAGNVDTGKIILGMEGAIVGSSPDGGYAPCEGATGEDAGSSGTPAFCSGLITAATAVAEGRPTADITGAKVYAIPVAIEELLSTRLGLAAGSHLVDQGFALGWVVDAQGNPVKGAILDVHDQTVNVDVRYFDDDFNAVASGGSTNALGMFVIVAPGSRLGLRPFSIKGHPEFGCQPAGAMPGSAFNLIFDARKPGGC